jgi:hypothetical protein
MLSKVSQTQKDKYHMLSLMWKLKKKKRFMRERNKRKSKTRDDRREGTHDQNMIFTCVEASL